MKTTVWLVHASAVVSLAIAIGARDAREQKKMRVSYSSADATNAIYFY